MEKQQIPANKALYGEMLIQYCKAKGLYTSKPIDKKDFEKWMRQKVVMDERTPEQRKTGKGHIMALTGVLKMTQEEADGLGVRAHRKAWLKSVSSET